MPCCYGTPRKDDFSPIPELQVCIAEALYRSGHIVSANTKRFAVAVAGRAEVLGAPEALQLANRVLLAPTRSAYTSIIN